MGLSQDEFDTLASAPAEQSLARALSLFKGRVAVISSFGAESAVLLALLARLDRNVPVFFLDTKRHFPETLSYRDRLAAHLGLNDVRTLVPSPSELTRRDPEDQLAGFDPDACCALRKVEPLEAVLPDFDIWITGRKRAQAQTRARMPVVERQADGSVRLNPLAGWTEERIREAKTRWGLPDHPLVAQGYRSIGCAPCTRAVGAAEDARSGRWAGSAKTECGIHRPVAPGAGSAAGLSRN